MLQITRQSEYAIRGIKALVEYPGESPVQLKTIAEACDVSEVFLAKIFQLLGQSGIVKSQRGVKGGFILNKPAEEITILEIVEICEGKIELNHCLCEASPCPEACVCQLAAVWRKAQNALTSVLSGTRLSDVI